MAGNKQELTKEDINSLYDEVIAKENK